MQRLRVRLKLPEFVLHPAQGRERFPIRRIGQTDLFFQSACTQKGIGGFFLRERHGHGGLPRRAEAPDPARPGLEGFIVPIHAERETEVAFGIFMRAVKRRFVRQGGNSLQAVPHLFGGAFKQAPTPQGKQRIPHKRHLGFPEGVRDVAQSVPANIQHLSAMGAQTDMIMSRHNHIRRHPNARHFGRPGDARAGGCHNGCISASVIGVPMGVPDGGYGPTLGGGGGQNGAGVRRVDRGGLSALAVMQQERVVIDQAGELVNLEHAPFYRDRACLRSGIAAMLATMRPDFMAEALALARAQLGRTAPNPSVGCVIVRDGRVLASAATGPGGRPHAEQAALAQCDSAGADVYVTLEPCAARSSGGSSCTDLLIEARVRRVFIASRDPHPLANGLGVDRLKAAGILVETGVMQAAGDALNAGFFLVVNSGRPLVGESVDGLGFDGAFQPLDHETLAEALARHAQSGLTRVYVAPGGALALELGRLGLLSRGG